MKYRERINFKWLVAFAFVAVIVCGLAWWDRHRGWVVPCRDQDKPLSQAEVERVFDESADDTGAKLFEMAMFGMDSEADYWDLVKAYTRPLKIRSHWSVNS